MSAVPFGRQAASSREGGWFAEEGVRCFICGSKWALSVTSNGYQCAGECDPAPPIARRRRQPKQVWERT